MGSRRRHGAADLETPVPTSADLTLLVETERGLAQLLERARNEAKGTVESTRAAIQARTAALDLELSSARARFQVDVEAERARRGKVLLEEGKRRAAEYDAMTPEGVARLGGLVLDRLLSGMSE
jgi:hypothetical protein